MFGIFEVRLEYTPLRLRILRQFLWCNDRELWNAKGTVGKEKGALRIPISKKYDVQTHVGVVPRAALPPNVVFAAADGLVGTLSWGCQRRLSMQQVAFEHLLERFDTETICLDIKIPS
jgi:hypothetical protein